MTTKENSRKYELRIEHRAHLDAATKRFSPLAGRAALLRRRAHIY